MPQGTRIDRLDFRDRHYENDSGADQLQEGLGQLTDGIIATSLPHMHNEHEHDMAVNKPWVAWHKDATGPFQ